MNLLYELYLNSALRDDRISDRLSREQIDIKVRLAPIYCECFSRQSFDHTTEVFKRFHSLVNRRNDFVHANLTTPMKRPLVSEDDMTFLVETSTRDRYGLPVSPSDLTTNDIANAKTIIDDIVTQIIDSMRPRYRHEFTTVINQPFIHVTVDSGELVVNSVDIDSYRNL